MVRNLIALGFDTDHTVAREAVAGIGQQAGCDHTVTFDKGAAKSAGMQLLSVTSVA